MISASFFNVTNLIASDLRGFLAFTGRILMQRSADPWPTAVDSENSMLSRLPPEANFPLHEPFLVGRFSFDNDYHSAARNRYSKA
jgi:hypothetical protein